MKNMQYTPPFQKHFGTQCFAMSEKHQFFNIYKIKRDIGKTELKETTFKQCINRLTCQKMCNYVKGSSINIIFSVAYEFGLLRRRTPEATLRVKTSKSLFKSELNVTRLM